MKPFFTFLEKICKIAGMNNRLQVWYGNYRHGNNRFKRKNTQKKEEGGGGVGEEKHPGRILSLHQ